MTTPPSMSTYLLYVGIDIAATTFTAAWLRPTGTTRPTTATPPARSGRRKPNGIAAQRPIPPQGQPRVRRRPAQDAPLGG